MIYTALIFLEWPTLPRSVRCHITQICYTHPFFFPFAVQESRENK